MKTKNHLKAETKSLNSPMLDISIEVFYFLKRKLRVTAHQSVKTFIGRNFTVYIIFSYICFVIECLMSRMF